MRIPLVLGTLVGILGCTFAAGLVVLAPDIKDILPRLLLYLVAWGCLVFFPHCLAHFVVGTTVGIRFSNYSTGRSSIAKQHMPVISAVASKAPLLTLNIDKASLRGSSKGRRAVMFASGAAASMIFPFFVAVASLSHLPSYLSLVLFVLSTMNLVLDLYYSPKAGDLSRIIAH
jgi:hypothetical protein